MGKLKEKLDLIGQRFGRLIVIDKAPNYVLPSERIKSQWLCRCDCGNTKIIKTDYLRCGSTRGCGCLQRETNVAANTTHNGTHTRLYKVWKGIKQRCCNPNATSYKFYSGRGIKICAAWENSFSEFKNWALDNGYDMNAEYGDCTIDRIDVNGDYSPKNCRFVSLKKQSRNRSSNHIVTIHGVSKCIADWKDILHISGYQIKKLAQDTEV